MTWRYVRMVKTGSNSVATWMIENGYPQPDGHLPAREVAKLHPGDCLFGTFRSPMDWYASWYGHCLRGGPQNNRTTQSLRAYGRGSIEFKDVVYGLTHPAEVQPNARMLPKQDHLLNPAGDQLTATEGGLWTRSMRWFFQSAEGEWLVDWLILLTHLREGIEEVLGVDASDLEHRNAGGSERTCLEYDSAMLEWVHEADGAMWAALARLPGQHSLRMRD